MYLKALEIQGFKSFPDKTRLEFHHNFTAIVGPNGSGKSNISDAVMWVMGEQSSKELRGSKMEDVIFGGTVKRNPLGVAEVSLHFDNSTHIFDYDRDELVITRRYYRSGESEYYINKEQVRLKDINSLLMDTGLGRDGYSIIGQGKIADIVSSKSSERREVFDEAAGISRYRYRKEEAERKLSKADENLVRINDKLEELELQVEPLKIQAETAKKYLLVRDELRTAEVSLWMESLDRIHENAERLQEEYKEAKIEVQRAKNNLDSLFASSDSLNDRIRDKDIRSEQLRDSISKIEGEIADINSQIAVLSSEIRNKENNITRYSNDLKDNERRYNELMENINSANTRIDEIKSELAEKDEEKQSADNVIDGLRMKLDNRERMRKELNDRETELRVKLGTMESRINLLEEMARDYEGFNNAVKTVMREKGRLSGIHGPVINLIRTDEDYNIAIETVLGGAAQNIIVDTQRDGQAAIELLKKRNAGRATFEPIDTIRGRLLENPPENEPGYVGLAVELVKCDEKYRGIITNLLGRTVVAENLPFALAISKKYNNRYRIVTLDGQMINMGGSLTGGSNVKSTGVLSRSGELIKLKKEIVSLQNKEKTTRDELFNAEKSLNQIRIQLDLEIEGKNNILSDINALAAEKRTTENSITQLNVLSNSLSNDEELRKRAIESTRKEISDNEKIISRKKDETESLVSRVNSIKAELDENTKEKLELEGKRTKADREKQLLNEQMLDLERKRATAEQKKNNSDTEKSQLLTKLWDSYELGYNEAAKIRQPVESIQKSTKAVNDLRRKLSSLGNPNLGAIEEYDRVSERYEFFRSQKEDITKASRELKTIISDITNMMREIFLEKFDQIDIAFKDIFTNLFGGGKASLVLENPENVLESGIDIKVQPPGKQLSAISLMSGGEKAFVAIALYFAILRVRPTPFCVMDEIEAALDEANVTRYARFMKKISDKTQFIVITHRRGTMEEADALYGVTMPEKGVSTVLSIDLVQAESMDD